MGRRFAFQRPARGIDSDGCAAGQLIQLFGQGGYDAGNTGANQSDTYDGGAGNDRLNDYGTTDADVYRLNVGGGANTVDDRGGVGERIAVGAGVANDQIWFRRVGSDLEVSVVGRTDRMTVSNWYSNASYRIEQFQTPLPPDYRSALGSTIVANWQVVGG